MSNEKQIATKTSTKTFAALLVVAGVLITATAFAMVSLPKSSFYRADLFVKPGYTPPGYTPPGYSKPGYSAPGYKAPGYSAPGYSAPGYSAPGYTPPGYH